MPTYDYLCESCGHRFEEWQSFSEEPLKVCPQCQAESLRRLFGTGAAILFKGSGFYETDYRSESYKEAAKADQPPSTSSNGTSNGTASSSTTSSTPATSDSKPTT